MTVLSGSGAMELKYADGDRRPRKDLRTERAARVASSLLVCGGAGVEEHVIRFVMHDGCSNGVYFCVLLLLPSSEDSSELESSMTTSESIVLPYQ